MIQAQLRQEYATVYGKIQPVKLTKQHFPHRKEINVYTQYDHKCKYNIKCLVKRYNYIIKENLPSFFSCCSICTTPSSNTMAGVFGFSSDAKGDWFSSCLEYIVRPDTNNQYIMAATRATMVYLTKVTVLRLIIFTGAKRVVV